MSVKKGTALPPMNEADPLTGVQGQVWAWGSAWEPQTCVIAFTCWPGKVEQGERGVRKVAYLALLLGLIKKRGE